MRSDERRKHVRIRPLPELPIRVLRTDCEPPQAFAIHDVSIGGLGLVTSDDVRALPREAELDISIDVGRYGTHGARLRLRHVGVTLTGAELIDPQPAVTTALGKYLAELLERGAFS